MGAVAFGSEARILLSPPELSHLTNRLKPMPAFFVVACCLAPFPASLNPLHCLLTILCRSRVFLSTTIAVPFLLAGCGPSATIEEYVVEAETDEIFRSDLLKSEFGALPFTWDAPDDWSAAENDQFSSVAWETGLKNERVRITVSKLSAELGIPAQVQRWQGQVANERDLADVMEAMNLKSGEPATYITLEGPKESILGLMTVASNQLWIFKLRGSTDVVAKQRKRFRKFCDSISVQ